MHDDAVIRCVAYALYCDFRRFGNVRLEPEFPQSRFRDDGRVDVRANQRRLVAQFEEFDLFLCVHFLLPYSRSRDRPARLLVDSPLLFLILSMPRVTTPLFVQYRSAVSSVIMPSSKSSRTAMSKVFHPNDPAASIIS